tara:strand:+ start:2423 stop:4573 length:2151 start_codon:yes stop_codon:yes gene_type:complete
MAEKTIINRRDFIKIVSTAGTGLVIGFHLPFKNKLLAGNAVSDIAFNPNAWITVRPDNTVTISVAESEMGQGVWTSLPMIIAEEMELDWSKVQVIQAPVDKDRFGKQGTGGSASIRSSWKKLREAGAVAKEMLLEAAAQKWSIPKGNCDADKGFILNRTSGEKLSYGELCALAAELKVPKNISLKDPGDFRIVGKNIPRTDTPLKVNGTAEYAMDVDLPNMVHAFIIRCPFFGGKLKTINDSKAKRINGVLDIFEVENGIAVVGTSTWAALKGRKALDVTWDTGPNANLDSKSIAKYLKKRGEKRGAVGRNDGNARKALKKTNKIIKAVYKVPFQAHATMEPMNCVVDVQLNRCRIWAPTQFPYAAQKQAAEITGLSMDKIEMNVTFLGGGFGRRAFNDFVNDGLEVSKHMGRPVKLIWMREDDMRHDYYRPASRHILNGGLNENGETIAWTHKVVAPSILFGQMFKYPIPFKDKLDVVALAGAKELPYAVPNIRVEYKSANTDVPVGWWRSVYDSQNAYANECFMDELAFEAGEDPVQYRLKLLVDSPRSTGVLKMAAQKAGWGNPLPNGIFQGVSCHGSFGSYVAQVAEVSVQEDTGIKVHRVVCAVDCGQVINPSIVEAQMESSIVYGLSATLNGEITIEKGGVAQSNFHEFEVLRINEMPQVEVHIVESKEPPGGVGEPGLPPIAPSVANAVFAATGKRIRKLPIKPEDLLS